MEVIGRCTGCGQVIYSHREIFISAITGAPIHRYHDCWRRVQLYERDLSEEWRKLWQEAS